jgi:hypothetical protein
MASTAAITDQAKQDWLNGVHQPGDTYTVALYNPGALDKTTTAYTSSGETSGTGYIAGGMALSGFAVGLSTDTAYLTFTNPAWASSTFTASTALIYNASRSNKALAVLTFSSTSSTNGTWTLVLPAAGATSTITIA